MPLPTACRLCGAGADSLSVTTPHVYGDESGRRAFLNCEQCGVHFLFPPLSSQDEERFYRNEFEGFMEQRAGNGSGWRDASDHVAANEFQVRRRSRYLLPLLPPQASILEVGCSSGFMLYPLQNMGHKCSGVEPSGLFREYCLSHDISVFDSLDALQATAPGTRFDVIMHFFVLEHLGDPLRSLRQQLALLQPNGRLVIEVPNSSDPLRSIYDFPAFERFYWSVAHHWYWNEKSLTMLLSQLGCDFQIVREQRYDLSNHMVWAEHGRPGGQGRFSEIFGEEVEDAYRDRLIELGLCDTLVAIVSPRAIS